MSISNVRETTRIFSAKEDICETHRDERNEERQRQ